MPYQSLFGDDFEEGDPSPTQEHMRSIAKVGGQSTYRTYGVEHFTRIGKLGGGVTAKRGKEYYSLIGKKGALARKAKKDGSTGT